jgi:hypothetical protein
MYGPHSFSQNLSTEELSIIEGIEGTLIKTEESKVLVIILGDSGPSDRNGNQGYNRSNYLKKLSLQLANNHIASYRFDKRTVQQLKAGIVDHTVRFDDFVEETKTVIDYFLASQSFESVYLLGHGQGSLVGILAADDRIAGFISLCGAGKNIGDMLIEQVAYSAPELKTDTERVVALLKKGEVTDEYPSQLASAFNRETQAFLISWMAYEPKEEIKKLNIPVLVVNGDKNLQIPRSETAYLVSECTQCQLLYIDTMNHMLVEIAGDELENYKSYSDPAFPTSSKLVEGLLAFLN